MTEQTGPSAGWYPDPTDEAELRWWNGVDWSDDTSTISAAVAAMPPARPAPPTYAAPPEPAAAAAAPATQSWSTPNYVPPPAHVDSYPHLFDGGDPARRSRSGRALWLMLGGIAVVVAVAAVAGSMLVSSSYRSKLDTGAIETRVASSLSQRFGSTFTVTCPDNVALESGSSFTCDATADDGTGLTVDVHQDDDQGNVTWRPVG